MNAKATAGLLLALAAAVTCREDPPPGVAPTDAGYAGAPGRDVVSPPDGYYFDVPGLEGGPSGGSNPIGGGTGGRDGGSVRDGRTADRASADRPAIGCNLVTQNCGAGLGCYPGSAGYGVCTQAGSLGEDTPCAEHDNCAPGNLCVDVFGGGSKLCERVCASTATQPCPAGRVCQTFPGSTTGYCTP